MRHTDAATEKIVFKYIFYVNETTMQQQHLQKFSEKLHSYTTEKQIQLQHLPDQWHWCSPNRKEPSRRLQSWKRNMPIEQTLPSKWSTACTHNHSNTAGN